MGFRLLKGIPQASVERIEASRPFRSISDFAERTQLGQSLISRLAEADVFGSLELDRRHALWQSLAQHRCRAPLFAGIHDEEPPADLPEMPMIDQVIADYRTGGFSLKAHPVAFFREQLDRLKVTPAGELATVRDGSRIRVAGIVLLRQRPGTSKGITFATLEDESGVANLVIRPQVWERNYAVARRSSAWIAHGLLESRESVIHLVVHCLEDLSRRLGELEAKSRDFR